MKRYLLYGLSFVLSVLFGAALMFGYMSYSVGKSLTVCETAVGAECTLVVVPKAWLIPRPDRTRGA